MPKILKSFNALTHRTQLRLMRRHTVENNPSDLPDGCLPPAKRWVRFLKARGYKNA